MRKPEVLADTNVVSYLFLGSPLADDYRQLLAEMSVSVSFVTVGEMQFGAEIRCWSDARRNGLDRFLEDYPVAGYAIGMEKTYARVSSDCRRAGRALDWRDAWICTQALWFGVPLVTHDRDFMGIAGLKIISLLNPEIHDVTWGCELAYGVPSYSSREPLLSH